MRNFYLAFTIILTVASCEMRAQHVRSLPFCSVPLPKKVEKLPEISVPPLPLPTSLTQKRASFATVEFNHHAAIFNSASSKMFITKIEPIVLNFCGKCHCNNDHDSRMKLRRVQPGFANPEASDHNIRMLASFLDRQDPTLSPLLVKALTPHGGDKQAALASRKLIPFQYLELWTHWATGAEGSAMPRVISHKPRTQMTSAPVTTRPGFQPTQKETVVLTTGRFGIDRLPPPQHQENPSPVIPVGAQNPDQTKPAATPTPGKFAMQQVQTEWDTRDPFLIRRDDPYDPAVFNTFAHPKK